MVHEMTPIPKITRVKWTGGMTQPIEHLLYKAQVPEFKLQYIKKKKKTNTI
jgi:hypothetical protein